MASRTFIALDVGEKRIGVAVADDSVRIAVPFTTIEVDGNEVQAIAEIAINQMAETIVIGYPRNQKGEATAQTDYVEGFAKQLEDIGPKLVFQDESLTSVLAEQRLIDQKKPYSKGDIDAQAACIILQDYLEANYGY
jgi:putative Holliday junction resolvase